MQNLSLQQKLQQKLSPLQIQIMKLIEIPTDSLEQRIKEEIENNPVLEVEADFEAPKDQENQTQEQPTEADQERDETLDEYLNSDDDLPSYKLSDGNSSDDATKEEIPFSEGTSFYEHLEEQIGLHNLNDEQKQIARYIIGNIDEDGYLRRDPDDIAVDISFATNKDVEKADVETVLAEVRQFDPPGVGARDLRECLMLQLDAIGLDDPKTKLAYDVLDQCFDEFTKKHYDKIKKKFRIESDEELRDAIDEILHLNPKPGSGFSTGGSVIKTAQHITPDFIIDYEGDKVTFHLNSRNEPQLKISNAYMEMLEEYARNKDNQSKDQLDAAMFVRQKIDSAKWFIDALKQRRNTLSLVMQAIVDFQGDYFVNGDDAKLKPMILKDIAERTGLDPSTVSRASNSKYVQTSFGIVPLKYFFTEGIQSAEGEEVSSREVKRILQEAVDNEDKKAPLTDDKLVEILNSNSFNIARRTVAKYREQLGIPVARLRKQL